MYKSEPIDTECYYCDKAPVVRAFVVADPDDVSCVIDLCAYHWRYVQLCHRHGRQWSIMSAEAIDGRCVTTPFLPFDERYPDDIWPKEKRTQSLKESIDAKITLWHLGGGVIRKNEDVLCASTAYPEYTKTNTESTEA